MRRQGFGRRRKMAAGVFLKGVFWGGCFLFGLAIFLVVWEWFGDYRESNWGNKVRINAVVIGEEISVVTDDLAGKKLKTLVFPGDLRLLAKGAYGEYRLASLVKLGEIEKEEFLLRDSLAKELGVPLDYQVLSGAAGCSDGCWRVFWRAGWQARGGERIDLLFLAARLFSGMEVERIDFKKKSLLVEAELEHSGEKYFSINSQGRLLIGGFFKEKGVVEEGLAIVVKNGVGEAGLAAEVGRMVENLGGNLVELSDWSQRSTETKLIVSSVDAGSITVRRLAGFYGAKIERAGTDSYRADLVLVLGEDYYNNWY